MCVYARVRYIFSVNLLLRKIKWYMCIMLPERHVNTTPSRCIERITGPMMKRYPSTGLQILSMAVSFANA